MFENSHQRNSYNHTKGLHIHCKDSFLSKTLCETGQFNTSTVVFSLYSLSVYQLLKQSSYSFLAAVHSGAKLELIALPMLYLYPNPLKTPKLYRNKLIVLYLSLCVKEKQIDCNFSRFFFCLINSRN